jgi:hypothetical protein
MTHVGTKDEGIHEWMPLMIDIPMEGMERESFWNRITNGLIPFTIAIIIIIIIICFRCSVMYHPGGSRAMYHILRNISGRYH